MTNSTGCMLNIRLAYSAHYHAVTRELHDDTSRWVGSSPAYQHQLPNALARWRWEEKCQVAHSLPQTPPRTEETGAENRGISPTTFINALVSLPSECIRLTHWPRSPCYDLKP